MNCEFLIVGTSGMSQLTNQKITSIKTISNPVHHHQQQQPTLQQHKPPVLSIVKPGLTSASPQQQSPKPVIVAKRMNQTLSPNFTSASGSQVSPPVVSVNKLPNCNKIALNMSSTPTGHKVDFKIEL